MIDYVNTVYLAFYLDLDKQYGVFISDIFIIVFFEFDTGAPWFETTGSRNNLASSVVSTFRNNGVTLVAWYFDRDNDVLTVIDNLDYIYQLRLLTQFDESGEYMIDMDVEFIESGWSSILMKNIVGHGNLRVFSDFMLFERNNGRVVVYEGGTTQDFILHEWIGDPEAKIGEYLWIGEDSVLGDIIIAFSRRK